MIHLLFPFAFCEDVVPAPPTDTPSALMPVLYVLLLIDLVFLLYCVFGPEGRFKEYTRFLLLIHGSLPVFGFIIDYFNLHTSFWIFIVAAIILIIAYYYLCRNELFVQIITIANCCLLFTIVIKSLLGSGTASNVATGTGFIIACGVFIFLGITRFEMLYKIHTIFVCYVIIAYLVDKVFKLGMLSGSKDLTSISVTLVVGIVVFGILTYLLFFK